MSELDGIAIVGMAARAPGANGLEAFAELARSGRYAGRVFADAELAAFGVPAGLRRHPDFVPVTGPLDEFDAFDHAFFGLTPREAELHDPQLRVMLETVWHALEDAGCDPSAAPGPVGVFAGMGTNGYYWNNVLPAMRESQAEALLGRAANDKDFLATLISYKLDLRGPSMSVQSACSTSLVAVHLAVQSLLAGECDSAVAGGVSVLLPEEFGALYAGGGIASRDGRCRPFDAAADGTFGGSGAGAVVLRRLEDALAAGDAIYAVIRGSAVNNDGARKVGFTAPSIDGQVAAIEEALAIAQIDPATIGFVETHGTATAIGDAIELRALRRAFAGAERGTIALGAIKSAIGHLDAAAGIVGLIRAALAVARGEIPGSPYFERPNPLLELETSPFVVPTAPAPWRAGGPRRAGVSSFGIGGTNAHVVLEQAPAVRAVPPPPAPAVYVVSARSAESLAAGLRAHAGALARRGGAALAGCAQASRARPAFPHRAAVAAATCAEAAAGLSAPGAAGRSVPGGPAVVFAFPGQGAQYAGMAEPLYRGFAAFRAAFDACAEAARPALGRDLRELVFAGDAAALGRTEHTQPALFAVEYATARLWESLGVHPAAMIGHSVGEYVAAALAEVFSLADAVALVAERGRLMQAMEPGAMLAVALDERRLRELLPAGLEIAALNGPLQTVVGGAPAAVAEFAARLAERGVRAVPVATSLAFHTRATEPVLGAFAERLSAVRFAAPARRYVSNVSGDWADPAQVGTPAYWLAHTRGAVRYAQGLGTLLRDPRALLLEVGPGRTLTDLARRRLRTTLQRTVTSLPVAAEAGDGLRHLLAACAQLWVAGAPLDLGAATPAYEGPRERLPGYAFERRRAYLPPASAPAAATSAAPNAGGTAVGAPAGAALAGSAAGAAGIEATVLAAWRDAFGVDEIAADDDFFALGGNSLTASAVVTRLRGELRLEFPIAALFAAPSVREFSAELARLAGSAVPAAAAPAAAVP
ncbi:MAG: phthiocerol/phenolphthiocerol synthesis type-I polyketide synthase, partial [Candidatus Eremiobacteraeota bacterium]|nr:phthiocerol/phenolphthiocerol synthesis type-I polyketide synthase [Candidatus Eremiobacteraeota bacterium]